MNAPAQSALLTKIAMAAAVFANCAQLMLCSLRRFATGWTTLRAYISGLPPATRLRRTNSTSRNGKRWLSLRAANMSAIARRRYLARRHSGQRS